MRSRVLGGVLALVLAAMLTAGVIVATRSTARARLAATGVKPQVVRTETSARTVPGFKLPRTCDCEGPGAAK